MFVFAIKKEKKERKARREGNERCERADTAARWAGTDVSHSMLTVYYLSVRAMRGQGPGLVRFHTTASPSPPKEVVIPHASPKDQTADWR